MNVQHFQSIIWQYYHKNRRDLPWRNTTDPYQILISEIMLQQTQVSRVLQKYAEWLREFPTLQTLKFASLEKILRTWQGLGYNRRALHLKEIANLVIDVYDGIIPHDPNILITFSGIGHTTSRSIITFAWNIPTVFLETNIRRTFIYHFFKNKVLISDRQIKPLVEKTLDKDNPREWYYALMDYGANLIKHTENPNRKSKHYVKQSTFNGSDRQIRGMILRTLLEKKLLSELKIDQYKLKKITKSLIKEGFIKEEMNQYIIS